MKKKKKRLFNAPPAPERRWFIEGAASHRRQ
jgi:hypothetical protein